ncbi:TonB-dependent receptor [Haliea sp. E17]|uniref:TonB-dependent receptor n=1 Tax=Haliea sp. E17 TaxID=3401576 RepID=UPI003AB0F4AD
MTYKFHPHPLRFVQAPLALAVALNSIPAFAQGSGVLEEIIVTAEHREETLQATQISMSALGSETIRDLGISNGLDIGNLVPNLNAQPYVGGRTGISFNIRGIGNSETLITFDPAVSVYLDGVLIAKNVGSLLDVLDLERIEVLRGPQGTLYGRNTMGGAINYITRKPTDEFEGNLQATAGNYGRRDLRGMLNVPLLGDDSALGELNVKVNGGLLNRDGIQDNHFGLPPLMQGGKTASSPQDELGTVDREVFAAQLQWVPTDNFTATYMYDYTNIDEIPESPWTTRTNPATFFGGVLAPYAKTKESERPTSISVEHIMIAKTEVEGHSLNLNWELGDNLTLTSLTGYREMDNYGEADSDGAPVGATFPDPPIPPAIITRDNQEYESISQEFRLLGSAFNSSLDYSLGVFYMDEEGDLFNETTAAGSAAANIANYENEAWAVYGQGTYNFTDALNLTAGARYTEEDREMDKALVPGTGTGPVLYMDNLKGDPVLGNYVYPGAGDTFDNVSWLVSLGYDWTPDIMTYAKISTGYQSGGYNARDIRPEDFVVGFKEETILAYELGLKSTFDNRFQVNASVFFSDYDDKRVNQFDPVNLVSIQRNAGVVEIYGAEVEMLAQLTDHWRAGLNYGYTHKEYIEYEGASGEDLSDMANFPYSPDNTASANLTYEYPLSFGVFKARADWSYRDEMTFLTPVPERNSSGDLQLWNARIALEELNGPGDSTMSFALWGKNLTDEGYYNFGVNIYSSFGFDINTYGEPMTWGMDVAINF